MCSTEAMNICLSHLFFLNRSRPWPPIQQFCSEPGRYKGPLLLVFCPCTSGQDLQRGPLGGTTLCGQSSSSLGLGARGQASMGSSREELLHQSWELDASCHKGWVSAPCRCHSGPLCYFQPFPFQASGGDLDSVPDLVTSQVQPK